MCSRSSGSSICDTTSAGSEYGGWSGASAAMCRQTSRVWRVVGCVCRHVSADVPPQIRARPGVAQGRPGRPVGRGSSETVGVEVSSGRGGITVGDGLTVMGPTATGGRIAAVVPLVVIRSGGTNGFTTTQTGPVIATVERGVGTPPLVTVEGRPVEAAGGGDHRPRLG